MRRSPRSGRPGPSSRSQPAAARVRSRRSWAGRTASPSSSSSCSRWPRARRIGPPRSSASHRTGQGRCLPARSCCRRSHASWGRRSPPRAAASARARRYGSPRSSAPPSPRALQHRQIALVGQHCPGFVRRQPPDLVDLPVRVERPRIDRHVPPPDDLAAATRVAVPRGRQLAAEPAPEAGLLLDLAQRRTPRRSRRARPSPSETSSRRTSAGARRAPRARRGRRPRLLRGRSSRPSGDRGCSRRSRDALPGGRPRAPPRRRASPLALDQPACRHRGRRLSGREGCAASPARRPRPGARRGRPATAWPPSRRHRLRGARRRTGPASP